MTDRYEKIREALEMGPTPGPWRLSIETQTIIKQDLSSIGLSMGGVLIGGACGHESSWAYPTREQAIANARLIAACDPDTIRALLAERDALVEAIAAQQPAGVDEAPDPSLLRFYGVSDYPSLVAAMEEHVLKLIDTHKRNVKPWEDTFPPTLLPKWVREQGVVPTEEGLALAQKWEDEAAESWGEDDAHRAKQECCDELRGLLTAALAAQQQGGAA